MRGAPKKPGAYPTPATRPFKKTSNYCFPVAADSAMVPNLRANDDNNNQDSSKRPEGNPADEATKQPEGKP